MNMLKLAVLSIIVTLFIPSAYAVQTPVPHVRLWNSDLAVDQWFLDFDSKSSNGVTPALATWSCSDSGLGTTTNVKTTKWRVEFRDSTTGAIAWAALENDVTPAYDATYELVSNCQIGNLSVAIANLKNSKVVLVAASIPMSPAYSPAHHLSAYSTTSTNGTKLWTRTIVDNDPLSLGPNSGWIFLEGLSGVGDFLKGDGVDEIRLVYLKHNLDGSADWNYVYLDAGTGIQIPNATKSYHVVAP